MVSRRQLCSRHWEFKDRLILETLYQTEPLSPITKQHIYPRAVLQCQNTQVKPCKEKSSRSPGAIRSSGACSLLLLPDSKG